MRKNLPPLDDIINLLHNTKWRTLLPEEQWNTTNRFFFLLHACWHFGNSAVDGIVLGKIREFIGMVNGKRLARVKRASAKRQLIHAADQADSQQHSKNFPSTELHTNQLSKARGIK